jgi:hypothetical protein
MEVVMRARRTVAALGTAVLAVTLSGCLNLTGEIAIGSDATITGQQRVEMNKTIAAGFGVTDLAAFEKLVNGDGELSFLGITPTPEASEEEDSDNDCPNPSVEQTDTTFVALCTYENHTPGEDSDLSVSVVNGQIQFAFEQEGTPDMGGETGGEVPGGAGVLDLTINFPGAITAVGGTTAAKATKLDDDTIQIKGTALEAYDVTVTSATTGGTNGEPSVNAAPTAPVATAPDLDEDLKKAIDAVADKDDDSTPWGAIAGGLLVLALIAGAVTFVLVRKKGATPATAGVAAGVPGAAGAEGTAEAAAGTGAAAPGWYPFPGDPSGQPRYWDGTSWSEPGSNQ